MDQAIPSVAQPVEERPKLTGPCNRKTLTLNLSLKRPFSDKLSIRVAKKLLKQAGLLVGFNCGKGRGLIFDGPCTHGVRLYMDF